MWIARDLAIRARRPDLQIDWFTVDPAASYLVREGERLHPITRRLASESRHFERQAGEHDLHAFFALRTMDEIMSRNFLTFADLMFGPGMPNIRDWTQKNFAFSGYALPFDPATLTDIEALRARHGYRMDEKLVVAAVGGTEVGRPLLIKIAESFEFMKRQEPALRLILVAGPRLPTDAFAEQDGLEVRPYGHNLFEHLACSDLALVQGA